MAKPESVTIHPLGSGTGTTAMDSARVVVVVVVLTCS